MGESASCLCPPTRSRSCPSAFEAAALRSPANNDSRDAAISGDGRFAGFASSASNLIAGDTNGATDVFLRDLRTGAVERVSVAAGGAEANDGSSSPAVSDDGRFVVFASAASNLVPGDTNGRADVFVRDVRSATIERVSVSANGVQGNAASANLPTISADGRFVAFNSDASNLVPGDTNGVNDVFVRDVQTGALERLGRGPGNLQPDGPSFEPSLSADGRFVAFSSNATNLAAADTNGTGDVFVRDRQAGTVQRVSVASSGSQADSFSGQPSISADGRVVVFGSTATNLVAGSGEARAQVYAHDRLTSTTERISSAADGAPGDSGSEFATVSPDGRLVAFVSNASNLGSGGPAGDLLVRDRVTGALRVAAADVVSDDGSEVAPRFDRSDRALVFTSENVGVVPGDGGGFDAFLTEPVRDALQLSVQRLDFGRQAASTAGDVRTVEVRGPDALLPSLVGSVRLAGPGADQFLLVRDECSGRLLQPTDTCNVGVRFMPARASGDVAASLQVAEADGKPVAVELAGTGAAGPEAGAPGPVGPAGPPGPRGPQGAPGRVVICRSTSARMCEVLFAAGTARTTGGMRLTRNGRTVAQTHRRLRADRDTRLVLRRPRGLRAGRYRLTVYLQRSGARKVVARQTVRLRRMR